MTLASAALIAATSEHTSRQTAASVVQFFLKMTHAGRRRELQIVGTPERVRPAAVASITKLKKRVYGAVQTVTTNLRRQNLQSRTANEPS
jgi:UDP-N-acetyl-D-mannosaminuronate dehydrogenase